MSNSRVRVLSRFIVAALAVAATMVVAVPAHAYPANAIAEFQETVNVDPQAGCASSGPLAVYRSGNFCRIDDEWDNTGFAFDADAQALKLELRRSGTLVAKVEFHPLDEVLWIYDWLGDGDTVYVDVCVFETDNPPCRTTVRRAKASGNPATILDLSYAEGTTVQIDVWDNDDDRDPDDRLARGYAVA